MGAFTLILILTALITVPSPDVVADELVNSQTALLTEMMRLQTNVTSVKWSLEESVEMMRDIFIKRIRCGIQLKICEDCLSALRILDITSGNGSALPNRTNSADSITQIQDINRMAVVFLNYFLTFQTSCTAESIQNGYVGSCRIYDQCWSEIHPHVASMTSSKLLENVETIENILREVKAVYEPDPSKSCFSAEKVLNELDARSENFRNLPLDISTVLVITSHLFSGECIDVGESVADFLDDIFLHYGDGCERIITQKGFTKLWNDLQTQRRGKHIDHGVQQNSCSYRSSQIRPRTKENTFNIKNETNITIVNMANEQDKSSMNAVYKISETGQLHANSSNDNFRSNNSQMGENKTQIIYHIPDMKIEEDADSSKVAVKKILKDSDKYSLEYEKERTDNVEVVTTEMNNTSSRRTVRHTPLPEDHEHKNLANECLPSDDLLRRFLTRGNKVITSLEFLQLCPALVQQAVSGVCNTRLLPSTTSIGSSEFTVENGTSVLYESPKRGNPWHAVFAVTIITGASLLGLFLLPMLKKPFFIFVNAFFTGLAFGTMSGDVVLHIMPQYLGLHKHDENGHDHNEEEETMWETLFPAHLQRQLVFLLTLYLLLFVESLFSTLSGEKQEHHGHSHGPIELPMKDFSASGDVENMEAPSKPSRCTRIIGFFKPSNIVQGITSKVIVILLADTVHNFADGMAIGVGYSTSNKDGFSTSVAVFFHELPHEIGDFALLMNCGLSYWKAFFFNILSGFSAFIGLGVGVFTASAFKEWLLCITAGLFFFVVMGEMLPDMRMRSKEEWKEYVVKIIGTLIGMLTMICIAIYEQTGAF